MRPAARYAAALVTLIPFAESATSIEPRAEPATATRTTESIHVDGVLDEGVWSTATPVTRFFETYPGNIQSPSAATEARFLYDDESVYVAIRAYDPEPAAIRSSLVRRDQVGSDQDYVEVLIDTQGRRSTAMAFRTNPRGVATDSQFIDDAQARNFAPDFNFDARATVDSLGWSAELCIPLSTLRYRPGTERHWVFVVLRNRPRSETETIASVPVPRSANCTLCIAGELQGVSLREPSMPLYITPHLSQLIRSDDRETGAGVDAKWQPRPETALDLMIAPDFSQVDVDALQLTANTLFAIATAEKRPFFLEGVDLLSTPIAATYTRAFSNPDAGVRFTRRGDGYDYTALTLRESAGDRLLEPGTLSSDIVILDEPSTALIARHQLRRDTATVGTLASGRLNDDGSRNIVAGADVVWTPSLSDRFTAQLLWSQTRNPDRPDLVPTWTGQRLDGTAAHANWSHTDDEWNSSLTYSLYSRGFRAWNGFVTQVNVARTSASAALKFYPEDSFIVRVSPTVSFSQLEEMGGPELNRTVSGGFTVDMKRGTMLSLSWSPDVKTTTLAGQRSSSVGSVALTVTPAAWMPGLSVSGSFGSGTDVLTGETGDSANWSASLPLRLVGRLELNTAVAHQSLRSRGSSSDETSVFSETNTQLNAIWHHSGRLYFQGTFQDARLDRDSSDPLVGTDTGTRMTLTSFLISYQSNWQTRYYAGFRQTSEPGSTEVFAKLSHVFSM